MNAVRSLLGGAIDYAGLFPPASLDLESTVGNYARYREGGDAWALGRLVLPAAKLAEFADRWPEFVRDWPISLLLGTDYETEMRFALDCGLTLDCVECRPVRLEDIASIRRLMPQEGKLFVESPATVSPVEAVRFIAEAGACAKIRTGGATADAIPGENPVAAFLVCCAQRGLCLKATAGLHHAIRGSYRLTYAADSPSACMHGFVNFFLAAASAFEGANAARVAEILADGDKENFRASENELRWGRERFAAAALETMRQQFAISFGSCSFEEPVGELRAMGWIA